MKIAIVYVYAVSAGEQYLQHAIRFVKSYNDNPPMIDHDSIVVLNGGTKTAEIECLFSSLRNVTFLERDNSGYDIGGYQEAAQKFPCDMMVFFGSTAYLKGPGWLLRMVASFIKHGPALYGTHGNRGDSNVKVSPHVRTTGFWTTPDLMNRYPNRITQNDRRYFFEHGKGCFADWIKTQGLKVWVVSWTGEYLESEWDSFPNGFHRNDQSALLCGDRLTEPPYWPTP